MKKAHSSTPVELEFPEPEFNFRSCVANLWNGSSPVKSHFWNALSSLLPNIEFCAIRKLLPIIPTIADEKLNREIVQFCGQEAAHGKAHARFNAEHLHTTYPFLAKLEAWERGLFSIMGKVFPTRLFFALFVAVEHWTAAFSHFGLEDPEGWFADSDPTMFRLWEWHAVEELAHKAVCFDVYRYIGGGYFFQQLGMIMLLAFVMLPGIVIRLLYFFWKDSLLFKFSTFTKLCSYLFGKSGILSATFMEFLRYFKPGYQPWQLDSRSLIQSWRLAYAR